MPFNGPGNFPFTQAGITNGAPRASGVYGIFNSNEWIYVGESTDIETRLFEHLNGNSDQSACILGRRPTGFTYETCPAQNRTTRESALIRELGPSCNRT